MNSFILPITSLLGLLSMHPSPRFQFLKNICDPKIKREQYAQFQDSHSSFQLLPLKLNESCNPLSSGRLI